MTVTVADTSFLLAVFDRAEPEHERCQKALATVNHLVVSPIVLAELDYLISQRRGSKAALQALEAINRQVSVRRYAVPEVGEHLTACASVLHRYPEIGLTDALNVALAATYRTEAVGTLDRRHMRMVRPLTGHISFRLLPDDL